MKKTLYLECYSGISGDMTVAALIDMGADKEVLKNAVDSIRPIVSGFDVEIKRVNKSGIDACDFNVILDHEHENHDHDMEYLHGNYHEHVHHHEEHHHEHEEHHHEHVHEHYHSHTGMTEITDILNKAKLTEGAKKLAFKIFDILAQAESKAHNKPVNEVHFHEVGAVDSIVDIMSAAVCFDDIINKYDIDDIVVSELYEGHGSVRCQHGVLPVPVPAVSNIVETYRLPVHFMNFEGEFVTPTGAAIAAAVRTSDRLQNNFKIVKSGIGAGKRNYEKASILRAMIVEPYDNKSDIEQKDSIYKLETNIDDCTGEALGYVMDRLFKAGARDVYYTPVFMKKNRPAYQLNVICKEDDVSELEKIIFNETTTIGIRKNMMERTVLKREKISVNTSIGRIDAKICGKRIYPEYESLVSLCKEKEIPYQETYNKVFYEMNTVER